MNIIVDHEQKKIVISIDFNELEGAIKHKREYKKQNQAYWNDTKKLLNHFSGIKH